MRDFSKSIRDAEKQSMNVLNNLNLKNSFPNPFKKKDKILNCILKGLTNAYSIGKPKYSEYKFNEDYIEGIDICNDEIFVKYNSYSDELEGRITQWSKIYLDNYNVYVKSHDALFALEVLDIMDKNKLNYSLKFIELSDDICEDIISKTLLFESQYFKPTKSK
jgi:hypothetical protein